MRAYKCGLCLEFKDGEPANHSFYQYISWGGLKFIRMNKIEVHSEIHGDVDLCEDCLLKTLKAMVVYLDAKYPHNGTPKTLNSKVNKLI